MFCFAEKTADKAPSSSLKMKLLQNGLREKRVSFPVSATANTVKDLLYEFVILSLVLHISVTKKIRNFACVYNSIHVHLKFMWVNLFYIKRTLRAYPPLRHVGGFQLLISDANVRKKLKVISHGSCTTKQMRCFGTGRIYIRPLQRSMKTQDVKVDEEFVECIACSSPFAVSEMRRHQETCEVC